jgi:DNA adenine methylase
VCGVDGGKHYLASRIVGLMPPHFHYVEPYAGGLSVMLAKDPEGVSEVANDLNKDLYNFWRVLQGQEYFAAFSRLCQATPFHEAQWSDLTIQHEEESGLLHYLPPGDDVAGYVSAPAVRAWRFFVCCRQSLAGRMRAFTGVTKTRRRRGMNNEVSAWLSAVDGLPQVHERLRRVLVLNRPALEVVRSQDGPQTLQYLDPPYLHSTRASRGDYGRYEMTERDHAELLDAIRQCKGKVMLSGYRSGMYDGALASWNRHDFDCANHAAGGKTKRRMTECLWLNF